MLHKKNSIRNANSWPKKMAEILAERRAERELDRAERQAILNAMVQINDTLAQMAANQQNGQSPSRD